MDAAEKANEIAKDRVSKVLDQYDPLRNVYGDILQGFSLVTHKDQDIYIKHFGDADHALIAKMKINLTKKYLDMGVPSREERLLILKSGEEWTEDDEILITQHEYTIKDSSEGLQNLIIQQQRDHAEKMLGEAELKLQELQHRKRNLIGVCADSKAEKISSNYYIYFSLFKDKEFKENLWTEEEFDELEDILLVDYIVLYNRTLTNFNDRNFRKIASLPFVLNPASYCKDQGMFFFGKPVTEFTTYQMSIFSKAMRNCFILRESKGNPPDINNELMMQTLLDWYDQEYSIVTSPVQQQDKGETEWETQGGMHKRVVL